MNPEYCIANAESCSSLIEIVEGLLKDKWQLVGGICALAHGESTTYYQALFRVTPITTVSSLAKKVM